MPGGDRLPRVQTKLEFHECLEDWLSPPKRKGDEHQQRRPKDLKSYVLETNGGFKREGSGKGLKWRVEDTGVNKLKILRVEDGEGMREWFMDTADGRFYILHTNEGLKTAARVVDTLTDGWSHSFDRMWMHHAMLEAIAKKSGNTLGGFGVRYSGDLDRKAGEGGSKQPIEDLRITVNGSMAHRVEQIMQSEDRLQSAIAYNRLRITRGEDGSPDCASVDVTSKGYFAMKHGKSIPDHLDLVDISKDVYSETVVGIEKYRFGTQQAKGTHVIKGKTIDITFRRPIPDLDMFLKKVFNTTKPFRIFGLKSKLEDGYFKVLGTDMHTGDSMNFEVTRDFMRVYLSERSCGNSVLRLLTNLQHYYGRGVTCERVDRLVR